MQVVSTAAIERDVLDALLLSDDCSHSGLDLAMRLAVRETTDVAAILAAIEDEASDGVEDEYLTDNSEFDL